jgi:hypothetical protein
LQIVAGSVAGSKWMSNDLYKLAASTNKKFHVVEGANHMSLYEVPNYVDETVSVLAPFFKSILVNALVIQWRSAERRAAQGFTSHRAAPFHSRVARLPGSVLARSLVPNRDSRDHCSIV